MKIKSIRNIFSYGGKLYGFRSFFWMAAILLGLLIFSDYAGWRIFNGTAKESWSAGGPGYHK